MGFGEAVSTCFRKYADFTGRASRPEYWWFFLSYVVVLFVVGIVASSVSSVTLALLLGIGFLALIIPMLAAAVRRLHDTGRSGWWYFIGLVPLVGGIILLVLLATEGQPGPNQYGPSPRGVVGSQGAMPPAPPQPPT